LLRVNYRMLPELSIHMELWQRKQHVLTVFLETLGLKLRE